MLAETKLVSVVFTFSSILFAFCAANDCPSLSEFNKLFSSELSQPSISNFLKPENLVGSGKMGSIYKVPWIQTTGQNKAEIYVAVKKEKSANERAELENEIAILRKFNSIGLKHVAKYYGCFKISEQPFLVMEYLPHSLKTKSDQGFHSAFWDLAEEILYGVDLNSLPDFLKRFRDFPPEKRLEIYLQIAEGLAEMHALGYVHHDLKPDNIALGPEPELFVRLIDFGLTKPTTEGISGGYSLYFDRTKLQFYIGEGSASAKIKLDQLKDHWKADIWAFGLMVYQLENIQNFPENQLAVTLRKDFDAFIKTVRKMVLDKKWFEARNMNRCSPNKMVCFHDVMTQIMKDKRKDRTITASEIANALAQILGKLPEPQNKFGASKGFFSTIGSFFACDASKKKKELLII